jgi:hypothetical protein
MQKQTRKLIELPSGARVKIRPLSMFDFSKVDTKDPEQIMRAALSNCTGKVRFSETDKRQIVDKHFDDSDDLTEITIEELQQADAEMIVAEVFKLSGVGKEASESLKPFRQEPEKPGADSPDGNAIPQAAD